VRLFALITYSYFSLRELTFTYKMLLWRISVRPFEAIKYMDKFRVSSSDWNRKSGFEFSDVQKFLKSLKVQAQLGWIVMCWKSGQIHQYPTAVHTHF